MKPPLPPEYCVTPKFHPEYRVIPIFLPEYRVLFNHYRAEKHTENYIIYCSHYKITVAIYLVIHRIVVLGRNIFGSTGPTTNIHIHTNKNGSAGRAKLYYIFEVKCYSSERSERENFSIYTSFDAILRSLACPVFRNLIKRPIIY